MVRVNEVRDKWGKNAVVRALGRKGEVGDVGKSFAIDDGVKVDSLKGKFWERTAAATVLTELYSRVGVAGKKGVLGLEDI